MGFLQSLRYMQSLLSAAIIPQLHSLCVRGLLLYEMAYASKARMNKKQRNLKLNDTYLEVEVR